MPFYSQRNEFCTNMSWRNTLWSWSLLKATNELIAFCKCTQAQKDFSFRHVLQSDERTEWSLWHLEEKGVEFIPSTCTVRRWQHHVVEWFAALHKVDVIMTKEHSVEMLKQHVKKISQEVKNKQWPEACWQLFTQWLKNHTVNVLEEPSQSSDLSPIENLLAELNRCVRAKRPINLTHYLLSGGMGQTV